MQGSELKNNSSPDLVDRGFWSRLDPHQMSFGFRLAWFVFLNFGGLFIGSIFTSESVKQGGWYSSLNRAPWEPPGWVFGLAWTLIMLCFSWYLTALFSKRSQSNTVFFYLGLLLNSMWSPVFFGWHSPGLALLLILLLDILITSRFVSDLSARRSSAFLLLPYVVWLLIALSLNIWVVVMN